ncbi:MAG: type IV pilin protein [Methylococcaceae bacterium]|nr:type IV pilin protein [Methylococcaceae bacterium]
MNKQKAFTLIELMVAVVIAGILAAIAYPSYQESVRKSRRADVEGVLLNLANSMERHFTEFNTYCDVAAGGTAVTNCGATAAGATAIGDTGTPSIFTIPNEIARFYTVTISAVTNIDATAKKAGGYTLQAQPIAGGPQAIDRCGRLTLTHTGAKSSQFLTEAECW